MIPREITSHCLRSTFHWLLLIYLFPAKTKESFYLLNYKYILLLIDFITNTCESISIIHVFLHLFRLRRLPFFVHFRHLEKIVRLIAFPQ